jgi:hypothetical protein
MTESSRLPPDKPERKKACYVGAPAIFLLEIECKLLNAAFGANYGCYLVGSALHHAEWLDVDIRLIMDDANFTRLFPDASVTNAAWEFDLRWLILTTAISERLSRITNLPIDFQFQPQTQANLLHDGERNALGLTP